MQLLGCCEGLLGLLCSCKGVVRGCWVCYAVTEGMAISLLGCYEIILELLCGC